MLKQIVATYKQNGFLHHAYLVVGAREIIQPIITDTLKVIDALADVIWEHYETFGINDSRGLIERSSRHNWSGLFICLSLFSVITIT